jgi:hypothetical protein
MGWVILGVAVWAVVVFAQYFRLTDLCHRHIKDQIRSELLAAHRYKSSRRLTGRSGDGLWYPSLVRSTNPFLHVRLLLTPRFVIAPGRDSLRGVVVHWTPLVPSPDTEWCDELADRVAHFLAVDSSQVRQGDLNLRRRRLTITRA